MLRFVFYAALLAAGLAGCEKLDLFSIDAPSDLQQRIDSIAAAKAEYATDTTHLIIGTAIVGAEDNSSVWWGAFSDYFSIPVNKLLHLEFVNNGTGVNNWNNWNVAITNEVTDREASGYKEYFVLRSDAYGWGGEMAKDDDKYAFDLKMINFDYPDTDGDGDIWNDFRKTMQGAYVTLEIDHSATGNVFITAIAEGTDGVVLTQTPTARFGCKTLLLLITDGSHFLMKKHTLSFKSYRSGRRRAGIYCRNELLRSLN